jgi:hypothetical protein
MAASTETHSAPHGSVISAGRVRPTVEGPAWKWPRRPVRPVVLALSLLSVLGGSALSCSGDTTFGVAPGQQTQAYWVLTLNQHAVNLALTPPSNTVQLVATPRTAAGTPLTGLGPVTYTLMAGDTSVLVSPTGLVTAHAVTSRTRVLASLTANGYTLQDSVVIQVTPTPLSSPLATFSIHPAANDSAKRSQDFGQFPWPVRAADATGKIVCDTAACPLLVYYTSSNPLIATIDPRGGQVTLLDTGHVTFTATSLVYGVAEADSVVFVSGYQLSYMVGLILTTVLGILTLGYAGPKKLILGVGATVTFCNSHVDANSNPAPGPPIDIIFDKPDSVKAASLMSQGSVLCPAADSGNILPFGGDTTEGNKNCNNAASRSFPVPGVYHWHSTLAPADTFEIDIQEQH